jgi:hypothetical protein
MWLRLEINRRSTYDLAEIIEPGMNSKSGWNIECASYHEVETYADANAQIRDASPLISKKTNGLSVPDFMHNA